MPYVCQAEGDLIALKVGLVSKQYLRLVKKLLFSHGVNKKIGRRNLLRLNRRSQKEYKVRMNFYEYDDYRRLLSDKFKILKATQKKMSLEMIAKKIGISRSFLKMIMDKQRHISIDKLASVAKAFKMDRHEKNYFIFLACKALVKDSDTEDFFGNILRVLRAQEGAAFPTFEEEAVNDVVFADSLNMVLGSLKRFSSFQDNPKWMSQQLCDKGISIQKIGSARQALKEVDTKGDFVQGKSGPGDHSFQKGKVGLKMAASALETPEVFRPIQFYMCSLAFDLERERQAFQLFLDLRDKLKELSAQSVDPTSVLFISNNMFCVANKSDRTV